MAFPDSGKYAARAFAALALAIVLVTTVLPGSGSPPPFLRCIVCGDQGVADVIANMLLYLPLGAALALLGAGTARAVIAATSLSAIVELAQSTVIAGRDGSAGDVVANALGALLGVLVARAAGVWLDPAPARTWRWGAMAGAGAATVVALTGVLVKPDLPGGLWYGQWTPQFGNLEVYRGHVLEARLDDRPLPSRALNDSGAVRRGLLEGQRLLVRATAGPPTRRLSTMFSIFDALPSRILLFGVRGSDLVFYVRLRAGAALLIEPPIRIAGALAGVRRGDTIVVSARRTGRTWCAGLEPAPRCGLGYTAGSGAALLVDLVMVRRHTGWSGALWMACLLAPAAYWFGSTRPGASAATLVVACALVPAVTGLAPTTPMEWGGACAGVVAGWGLRAGVRVARGRNLQPASAG